MIIDRRQLLLFSAFVAAENVNLETAGAAAGGASSRWHTPEALVLYGFKQSRVVMINEAHAYPRRCVRTRKVGIRAVRAAHDRGVRHLAMEALYPHAVAERSNRSRKAPDSAEGFLAQPEMRTLIQSALDLGWSLIPYEASLHELPTDQMQRIELREQRQAENLWSEIRKLPMAARVLVWCGNGHNAEVAGHDWKPMAYQFRAMSQINPFTINQTVTVDFAGNSTGQLDLVRQYNEELQSFGGTAGFLREQAPLGFGHREDADAYILSIDNALE